MTLETMEHALKMMIQILELKVNETIKLDFEDSEVILKRIK